MLLTLQNSVLQCVFNNAFHFQPFLELDLNLEGTINRLRCLFFMIFTGYGCNQGNYFECNYSLFLLWEEIEKKLVNGAFYYPFFHFFNFKNIRISVYTFGVAHSESTKTRHYTRCNNIDADRSEQVGTKYSLRATSSLHKAIFQLEMTLFDQNVARETLIKPEQK